MLEAKQRIEQESVAGPSKTVFFVPVGTAEVKTLKVYEQVVRVTSSAYTCTVVLPNVAEAKGLTYNISCDSASFDVTITDGPVGFTTTRDWADLTLTAAEDQVTLLSDGVGWIIVENKAT